MTDTGPRVVPRLAELSRDAAKAINELVEVARALGRRDLGESLLDASKRWPEPHATVAVVGEVGVGRSTLVNALAGRLDPPLLPLSPDLTLVRAGAPEEVRVHRAGGGTDAGPVNAPPAIAVGDSVEVVLSEIEAGNELVLVDVPGIGLLDDPRRRLVEAIVETADAVVLVTRADAPVTGPEIDLVRLARRRTGAALAVMTHIDRHRGWRAVMEESAASFATAGPPGSGVLTAPPLPFSATLAVDAAEARRSGDGDEASALLAESGLQAIFDAIRSHITGRLRHVRLRALVELARGVAEELITDAAAQIDPAAALAEARAAAKAVRELSAQMLTRVADAFAGLRDALSVDVGREVATVLEEVEAALDDTKDVAAVVELAGQMLEGARVRLDDRAQRQVDLVVAGVLATLDQQDQDPEVGLPEPEGPGDTPAPVSTSRSRRVTASMRLRLVQATLSSTGGVAMLAVVGGGGGGMADSLRFGAMGAGMLVGGLGAAEGFRESKRQRTAQEARARARGLTEQWRAEYLAALRERLLKAQRAHETALRDTLRRQTEEADARVAELQAARSRPSPGQTTDADAIAVGGRLAAVQRRLDELGAVLAN